MRPSPTTPATLDPQELRAWRGMLQVHAAVTRELDAQMHREHGLSVSAYEVLMFLGDAEGGRLRMADIADRVLLSRSGLTRLVDRMERDGLLRRERCEDDARGYNALISDKGRELFGQARRTHLDGVRERFLSHLSPDELRTLARLWEKVAPGASS
jgi:DNA-binding MarR family transcriptional regulator